MKKILSVLGCISVVLYTQQSFAGLTDSACDDMYQSYVDQASLCGLSGHLYLDRTTYKSQCCSLVSSSSTGSSQTELHQNTNSPCYPCRSAGGGAGSSSGFTTITGNFENATITTCTESYKVGNRTNSTTRSTSIANNAQTFGTCPSSGEPTCSCLGYNDTASNCPGGYFTCPLDKTKVKCDRVASIGDIKYSTATTDHNGWLLCDGGTFNGTKYTVLKTVLGGTTLPDLRGKMLKAKTTAGTAGTVIAGNTLGQHVHYFPAQYINNRTCHWAGEAKNNNEVCRDKLMDVTVEESGTASVNCVSNRVSLNAFIYAGVKQD